MTRLKKIYNILACLLCVSLPFENIARIVPNILLGMLLLLTPFVFKKEDFKKNNYTEYLMIFGLIVYVLLRTFFLEYQKPDLNFIKKISVLIPVIFVFSSIKKTNLIVKSYIGGVVLCLLICAIRLIKYISDTGEFKFDNGDIINQILVIERLYLGFLCAISFGFSLVIYKAASNRLKKLLLCNMLLCFASVSIISARIGLLTIIFIGALFLFQSLSFKKAILVFSLSAVGLFALFELNDNLKNRFLYANDTHESFFYKLREWEPRIVIWSCSYDIFATHDQKIFGLGQYQVKNDLLSCYDNNIVKEDRKAWFLERQYNTHNQFIDITLSYGVFGLLLFCSLFLFKIIYAKEKFYTFILISVLVLFGLVENFFHRQVGVYLFAIVFIVINMINTNKVYGVNGKYKN